MKGERKGDWNQIKGPQLGSMGGMIRNKMLLEMLMTVGILRLKVRGIF